MRDNTHFYKTYAIKNVTRQLKLDHDAFHIIPNCGRAGDEPIDATRSLRSAKHLIDVWQEAKSCACGRMPLPHHYQCVQCANRRLTGRCLRLVTRALKRKESV